MPLPTTAGTATLDGILIHGWIGWVPEAQDVVDAFARIGQTGSGAQSVGSRARLTSCTGWIGCATLAAAKAMATSIEALQGPGPLSFADPWGRSLFVRVESASARPIRCAGASPFRVEIELRVEALP